MDDSCPYCDGKCLYDLCPAFGPDFLDCAHLDAAPTSGTEPVPDDVPF